MLARLAARFPDQFLLPPLYKRVGVPTPDYYRSFRESERAVHGRIRSHCGQSHLSLLAPLITRFPTLPEVAAAHGAPFREISNINSGEGVETLKAWRPDVIVSLGDRILKPQVLSIPTFGVMNGHSSLLPSYRGSSTEFWQLSNGESETGVTIHWMAERVDEGAILVQRKWPIPPGSTHWEMRVASQFLRLRPWRDAIRCVLEGEAGTPQGHSDQRTFGHPDLVDLYTFYVLGQRPPRLSETASRK